MTNFVRKFLEEFAKDNKNTDLTIFGSTGAGSPSNSADPEVLQSNSKFKQGWAGAALLNAGNLTRNPVQNEWSGLNYIHNYQINHVLQKGLQEYNTLTEYFIGDKVNSGTKIYQSLTDNNIDNALTDVVNWKLLTDFASNIVIVNSENDYPVAVAGVRTLEDGKNYQLHSNVTTSDELLVNAGASVAITGAFLGVVHAYLGSGTAIRAIDHLIFSASFLTITAPSGGNGFLADGAGSIFFNTCVIDSVVTGITIKCNSAGFVFCSISNFVNGIISADRSDAQPRIGMAMELSSITDGLDSGGTLIDVSGNAEFFTLDASDLLKPEVTETALNLQQSLKDNGTRININNTTFDSDLGGTIFAPNSLKQDYLNANFSSNVGIASSTVTLKANFLNSVLATTINTVNVPEPINARWTCGLQERMQFQDRATFAEATDIITSVLEDGLTVFTHNFSTDDIIQFFPGSGGTLPTGIIEGREYFIITDTASTYQISETAGGGVFDFTSDGSGTIYYRHIDGTNALSWVIHNGNENIKVAVNANFSMKLTGGGTKDMRGVITKSDVSFVETISSRASTVNVTSAKPQGSIGNDLIELSTGEGIRFEAENLTDATNLDVTDATVIISLI